MKVEVVTPEKELRLKQKRFVEEYTKDYNPKAAAVRAGYTPGGRNEEKLMANPAVQRAIEKVQANLSAIDAADRMRVLTELKTLAFDPEVSVQYKLKALELLMKHYGLLTEKLQTDNTITIQIAGAIKEIGQ